MTFKLIVVTIAKQVAWHIMRPFHSDNAWPVTIRAGRVKGVVLNLDLRKNGSYWLGKYDEWIFQRLGIENWLSPGDVAWDCGAYVGYYAAVFRRHVGDDGRVVAFEASSSNYARLSNMPILNHWTNVEIVRCAVGQDHAEIDFAYDLGGGSGPISTKSFTERVESERVRSAGIDELAYELGFGEPRFIKLDLEGAETQALRNGDRLFQGGRPVVLLEIHGPRAISALGEFLQRFDYGAWDIRYFNQDDYSPYRDSAQLERDKARLSNTMLCLPIELFSRRTQILRAHPKV